MPIQHPLNQAVIAQALFDLRNGQLQHCRAMGFDEHALDALKNPAILSVLTNARVSWCKVSINQELLERLLQQAHTEQQEIAIVDRMLRLEASTEMVSRFYGLTHQEIALRREVLGLTGRKGRYPVLDEKQDVELWHQWQALADERKIDMRDEATMLPVAMDLAESMGLPLAVVWAAIKNWQQIETEKSREQNQTKRADGAE